MKIIFLGPDGVGKSTMINALCEKLPNDMDCSYHYLVPGFLPNYRNVVNGKPVENPHASKTHGKAKSVVKLLFWLVEYNLGNIFFNKKNKLMIFDRYFYDIIVDPKRYCYGASKSIALFVAKFIPKPDLLIILDAPTNVIQKRKKEVPHSETERQRKEYLLLKNRFCTTIVIDTTNDISGNVNTIIKSLDTV